VQAAARARGIPYVATLTGTDVHQDLASPRHAAAVRSVLLGAAALLASSERLADLVIERLGLPVPVAVVPTAVEDPAGWRRPAPEADGRVLFLQVGGWREVKNNLFPLGPLATLAAQLPGLRLRYLGPVREEAYHARWRDVAPDVPFAEDGGVVDPGGMPAAYAEAAALLNTSHSEGASNAMLEAMAAARAVLASDVPGNAELLSFDPDRWEESTGVLYRVTAGPDGRPVHDPADFLAKARRLALDPALRRRIGENAHRAVLAAHTPDLELDGVLSSYRLALS
jgi:glycosyltransferase involved in cell wall biosynthesis